MNDIISQIINNFDWAYMLSVNVLTFIIIKLIDEFNNDKKVKESVKKIILICSTIALAITYKLLCDIDNRILLNSSILAPVAWDYIFKFIVKKIKIDYKNNE